MTDQPRQSHPYPPGIEELNLAEFPLALLAGRTPAGLTEARYRDTIHDKGAGRAAERALAVTPSGDGLPTPADMDVLLVLLALAARDGCFPTRPALPGPATMGFQPLEAIRLLGWGRSGVSYARLRLALRRWSGSALAFDGAWWGRAERRWRSERLSVLEGFSDGPGAAPWAATWNGTLVRSVREGHAKPLDLGAYFALKSPAARRLYRFLDKRFCQRAEWTFNLGVLAHEHLGMSREYHTGGVRRLLRRAIQELEEAGHIEEAPERERYTEARRGLWRVGFSRASPPACSGARHLARDLARCGVAAGVAADLASRYPPDHVAMSIAVHDWRVGSEAGRKVGNPAGLLVASIKGGYPPPAGFRPANQREAGRAHAPGPRAAGPPAPRVGGESDAGGAGRAGPHEPAVQAYLDSLSPEDMGRLEWEVAEAAGGPVRDWVCGGGQSTPFREAQLKHAVAQQVLSLLRRRAEAAATTDSA